MKHTWEKGTFVPLEYLASTSPYTVHLLIQTQVCTVFLRIVIFLNFLHVLGRLQNEEQNGHFYVDGKSY